MKNNTYVIKIWSNVLVSQEWANENIIINLVNEVQTLIKSWSKVVIVSSWAVALWKKKIWLENLKWFTKAESGQIFSSIWQLNLMNIYNKHFEKHWLKISQALLTRRDFSERDRYNSMKKVLFSSLELWVIPIINENDVLSPEELDFSDNDELSALIAAMVWAENLIILSNIDWLYDKFPWWNLIKKITKIDEEIFSMVWKDKSSMWTWWMESKLKTAKIMMDLWIKMHLANWKKENVIKNILFWNHPWTVFEWIYEKKIDSLRKWLKAWAVPKWKIQVSTIISDLLKSWKRASLLEIWVEKIEKHFEKWEVVNVTDEDWNCIWYWIAKINSNEISKQNKEAKIVIHTDYFINI